MFTTRSTSLRPSLRQACLVKKLFTTRKPLLFKTVSDRGKANKKHSPCKCTVENKITLERVSIQNINPGLTHYMQLQKKQIQKKNKIRANTT